MTPEQVSSDPVRETLAKPLDLSALLQDAFLAGRGLKDGDKLSDDDQAAWMAYDPELMLAYKRITASLDLARRAARSAPEAGKAVVKPLEWRENPLMNWVSQSIVGQYFVFKDAGDSTWIMAVPDVVASGEFETAVLAKAAAQADFETRILSALASVPAPSGEPVALEAAIRRIVEDAMNSAIPEPWEVSAHAAKRILALLKPTQLVEPKP